MMAEKRMWREIVLNNDTEVWNKEEALEGELVKIESDIGPKKSKMYTFKTEDGEIKIWGSTVLDNKLEDISEGQYLKIKYNGKRKSGTGNEYHDFSVFVDDGFPNTKKSDDEEIDISKIPF